jgi:hypothetical protein
VTETDTTTSATDLIASVGPFLENAASQLFGAFQELAQAVLTSRIVCVQCAAEQHKAAAAGTPDDQLPQLNTANVIAGGDGRCFAHVEFADRPLAPGQTASGLYVAGRLA